MPADSMKKATVRFWNVPNLLCIFRISGSFVLVGVAIAQLPYWFVGLYLLFAATDLIDGPLARWLDQRSDIGARLDSLADVLLGLSLVIGAFILSSDMLRGEILTVSIAIVSYIAAALFGFWKFGQVPSFHTYSAKVTHFLVAVAGISLVLHWSVWPLRIAALAIVLTNIESIAISWHLVEWRSDVPTLFRLLKENGPSGDHSDDLPKS